MVEWLCSKNGHLLLKSNLERNIQWKVPGNRLGTVLFNLFGKKLNEGTEVMLVNFVHDTNHGGIVSTVDKSKNLKRC